MHAQSRAPDTVIVVYNASTDGTAAAVRRHYPSVRLAELTRNTGGAGGFAYGTALALAGDGTSSGSWTTTRCPSRARSGRCWPPANATRPGPPRWSPAA